MNRLQFKFDKFVSPWFLGSGPLQDDDLWKITNQANLFSILFFFSSFSISFYIISPSPSISFPPPLPLADLPAAYETFQVTSEALRVVSEAPPTTSEALPSASEPLPAASQAFPYRQKEGRAGRKDIRKNRQRRTEWTASRDDGHFQRLSKKTVFIVVYTVPSPPFCFLDILLYKDVSLG